MPIDTLFGASPVLHLLPANALIRTGPVDHADWNYWPILGRIQRLRFQLATRLLPAGKVGRLLEVGYGSGVFMPELARHCENLFGIDIHPHAAAVADRLREHGITAQLATGSAESLPYEDESFDCVVAISSLEFVANIDAALPEIRRVTNAGGCLIVVTPGHSAVVDWGLKILTGANANADYDRRRHNLLPAISKRFVIETQRLFPPVAGHVVRLYAALRFRPMPRA